MVDNGIPASNPQESATLRASSGTIDDTNGFTRSSITWAWQQGDTADGSFAAIAGATASDFTPTQDQVGKYLRVCANFNDHADNSETRCWTSSVVVNAAPVAKNNTIYVPAGGTYTFSAGDFPFTDTDGGGLSGIRFLTAPTGATTVNVAGRFTPLNSDGTLTILGTGSSVPATINPELIFAVTYTPPANATAMAGYTSFTWRADDVGTAATITIDLVPTTQEAATGTPTVTAVAYSEGVELTASTGTVADANGIPTHRLNWQWQSAAAPDTGIPATSTYANINGATAATFTPEQEHIGRYIRACLRFMDGIRAQEGGTADSPTLCTTGNVISRANSVSVPITASESEPYVFKPSDFVFPGDGALTSLTIVTAIADGTGALRLAGMPVTGALHLQVSAIPRFTYYPPDNSVATPRFATFTFRVNGNTATRTMNIHLVEHLRLRLRLFLEGPLR